MRLSKPAVVGAVILLSSFSAWAAQRTFVSGGGNDANPCTHDLPCRSFTAAMAVTNANGEIVAVDSAGYGTVTITQAVAIVAPLGVHAGVSAFSGNGITVTAGASDVVVLRNLYVNSQGADQGIFLTSAAALHIEHCVVSGFSFDNIDLEPVTDAVVAVSDTQVRDTPGFGFYADSAQVLTVSIDHCRIEHNLEQARLVAISRARDYGKERSEWVLHRFAHVFSIR